MYYEEFINLCSVVPEMRPRKISDVIVHDLRKLLF